MWSTNASNLFQNFISAIRFHQGEFQSMPKAINKKELCNLLQVQDTEERLMATLVKGSLKFIFQAKLSFLWIFFLFGLYDKRYNEDIRSIKTASLEIKTMNFSIITFLDLTKVKAKF